MTKWTDTIAIYLSVGVLLYLCGAYLADSYRLGLAFALPGMASVFLLRKIKPQKKHGIGTVEFASMLQLEGKQVSGAYLRLLYPPTRETGEDEYLDDRGTLILNAIGYAKVGEEWAAKTYRRHKGERLRLVVAAIDVDRKALSILAKIGSEIKVLRPKEMLRKLRKQGVAIDVETQKTKIGWRLWLSTLGYRQAGLFALVALSTALTSIWVPFKTYYYVIAALNALMSLAVLVIKRTVKT